MWKRKDGRPSLALTFVVSGLLTASLVALTAWPMLTNLSYRVDTAYCVPVDRVEDLAGALEAAVRLPDLSHVRVVVSPWTGGAEAFSPCVAHGGGVAAEVQLDVSGSRASVREALQASRRVALDGSRLPQLRFAYTLELFNPSVLNQLHWSALLALPLFAVFFVVVARSRGPAPAGQWHGPQAWKRPVLYTVLLFAGCVMAVQIPWLSPGEGNVGTGFQGLELAVILHALLVAPVVEEILFRYWLLDRLRRRLNAGLALFISSAAFSAMHMRDLLETTILLLLGLLLGWIYLKTNRLWPCMLAHATWNALALALVSVATAAA